MGGARARVEMEGGELVVRPRGLNRLWAFKGEVRIPLAAITEVRRDVSRTSVPSGLRVPGTYVPGVIQAGTYRRKGERSFWLVGRTRTVTVVECPGARYDRVVLELGDDEAAALREALATGA